MSKRFVSKGDGSYESVTSADVAANLRNQGFAPGLASQLAAQHEHIATTRAKSPKTGQKQAMGPVSMDWELPDSGAKI